MKAAQINSYGDPEVIKINPNAPLPVIAANQILVENRAASINPFDWKVRLGFFQKNLPLQFPANIGGDFAGKVIALGADVKDFEVGAEVFGQASLFNGGSGAMAEIVAANVESSYLKPQNLNFEQAAALPLVGVSAIQALEEHFNLQKDQKILIHGGAGGIGQLAIQIAKAIGAYVATTVSTTQFGFVANLGVDQVIDYTGEDFKTEVLDFDAVFDTVGGDVTNESFKVLKRGGKLVSMLAEPSLDLATKYEVTAIGQSTKVTAARLKRLTDYIEAGKVKPTIAKIFLLEEIQAAFRFQEQEKPIGKVVLKIT